MKGFFMNIYKKLIFASVMASCILYLEAVQPRSGAQNAPNKISAQDQAMMEQMEQMQQMDMIGDMMLVTFLKMAPKFVKSLVVAYQKDPEIVAQKIAAQVKSHVPHVLEAFVKEVKEAGVDSEVKAMIQEIRPFAEEMLVHKLMQWVSVSAMSGIMENA